MGLVRGWAFLAFGAILVYSQTGPVFEAASVKPNNSGVRSQSQRTEGRTFRAINVPARTLIRRAYGLMFEDYRLTGAPDWTNFEHFDIVATIPEHTTSAQMAAMVRNLLAERFGLVAHTEVREAPAYELVMARKDKRLGPQLRPSAKDCKTYPEDTETCRLAIGSEITGRGQGIDSLARTLLPFAGRSIVEKTGLRGGFDFEIQASEIAGDSELPSIFTAIQEQLGLKLEPTRAPVEFVVVDRVERPEPN